MKAILKLFALPMLLIIKILCVIGNLLTNLSSYVLGLLLLVIGGCAVYCVIQHLRTSLGILAVMAVVVFLLLFGWTWLLVKAESLCEHLGDFIHS